MSNDKPKRITKILDFRNPSMAGVQRPRRQISSASVCVAKAIEALSLKGQEGGSTSPTGEDTVIGEADIKH